ncbi:nucleotidyltransferase family protein [Runella slithyformis]|uniref:4-diphosphocytidyl-2C-methyl-D-erythritol synthase n=1 Tax=Runella slithyformis (strain ATCC 29530 / DSM 19594 / LMG 11500 / NCIMB 11436 / LSU 4) TaxID=761193 RepID=A0A7U3ZPR3_RUNSL|nr:nucleotidyltransferase family protein [Runella slithyformis]AEI51117.1 4-diphosphocytidyl-2C-methyl-D-erythritol synthase [Runella slithyformis DSM 19594]
MNNIGIILLAAGESKRMGSPKQLLDIDGKSLLRRTAEVALATDCYPVVMVIGANKAQIAPEIIDLPLTVIDNPMWHEGMSSSVKMGLAGLYMTYKDVDAVIMLVCDQPYLSVSLLERMIDVYRTKKPPIVACKYGEEVGVPALFDRKLFEELLTLSGDKGAKPIVMNHLDEAYLVTFEAGSVDLDTPEDYEAFQKG